MPAMEWLTQSQSGYRRASRYLLAMRLSVVGMQLVTLVVTHTVVPRYFTLSALMLCALYAAFSALSYTWFVRRPPTTAWVVGASLVTDLALIAGWLLLTGGYANPLTSLLLLPIAVGIVLLPLRQGIGLTLIGILAYAVQMRWPSSMAGHHHSGDLAQLHLLGMGVAFALTAVILLLVVGALVRQIREQQTQLSRTREARLRDEQVIALGLSAAGVAHRLGTPLNTVALLIEEMRANRPPHSEREDLDLMEQQINLCCDHLQQLSDAAVQVRSARTERIGADRWMARLMESATLLWPSGAIEWRRPFPTTAIAVDATLDQAILNLVDNALSASPDWVAVSVRETGESAVAIVVEDRGSGSDRLDEAGLGNDVVRSEQGLGVGLLLSNATIQRLGGTLKAISTPRGTTMIIELPHAPHGD